MLPDTWSSAGYEAMVRVLESRHKWNFNKDLPHEVAVERWLELRGQIVTGRRALPASELDFVRLCLALLQQRTIDHLRRACRERLWQLNSESETLAAGGQGAHEGLIALVQEMVADGVVRGWLTGREQSIIRQYYFEGQSDRSIAEEVLRSRGQTSEDARVLGAVRRQIARERVRIVKGILTPRLHQMALERYGVVPEPWS